MKYFEVRLFFLIFLIRQSFSDSWHAFDQYEFFFSSGTYNWFNARTRCIESKPATIENDPQNNFVKSVLQALGTNTYWIGLEKSGNQWEWRDGSTSNYRNWQSGEPAGRDKCTLFQLNGWDAVRACETDRWNVEKYICKRHLCDVMQCLNGGICQASNGTAACTCVGGFSGRLCETEIDECQSNPCQNFAICQDDVNQYTCDCAPGYTGTLCETEIDECQSNPCQNGATCQDDVNQYTCDCAPGYTGTHCETGESQLKESAGSKVTISEAALSGIIAGMVVLFVLVIVAVIVAAIFKRRGRKPDVEESGYEMRSSANEATEGDQSVYQDIKTDDYETIAI